MVFIPTIITSASYYVSTVRAYLLCERVRQMRGFSESNSVRSVMSRSGVALMEN